MFDLIKPASFSRPITNPKQTLFEDWHPHYLVGNMTAAHKGKVELKHRQLWNSLNTTGALNGQNILLR